MKNKYIQAIFFFCLITMALFLYYDHFQEDPIKKKYYYIWIKVQDFLLFTCITWLIPWRYYKHKIVSGLISIFYLFRVIWQVFEMGNYEKLNEPLGIDLFFGSVMAFILLIILLPERFYNYVKNKMRWRK